jgi:CRP/FNR family transcriptional regulator
MNVSTRRNYVGTPSPGGEELGSIPAFSPTIQDGAELIPDLPNVAHIASGTILAKQDEKSGVVRLIRSGIVKLTYLDASGQEFVLGLRSEGWWMCSMQVLLDVPNLFTVRAITPCAISTMSADDFSQRLIKNPRMLRHYLSSVCREVVVQTKLHIMLLSTSAELRLRHMLDEHDNSVWKTLDPTAIMSQGEVAKLLAVTPEHLSRILHRQMPAK